MISGIGGSQGIDRLYASTATRSAQTARGSGRSGTPPSITLKTQDGDTVTITPKATQAATYGRPAGGALASLGLQSNDEFDVSISGELSEQERTDLQSTLAKMDAARTTLDGGDFAAGMQAMQAATQASGTVASVSGPGGPPPGGPPPGAGAASGASDTDALSALFDSDSDDDDTSIASWLASATSDSSGSSSASGLSSALGGTGSSTIEEFLQQVLNGLRSGSTLSVGTDGSPS